METVEKITEVFLDTGYVVALSSRKDEYHEAARKWAEQVSREEVPVLTTQDVLVEIGNALASVENRSFAVKYINSIQDSDAFEVVESSFNLFESGLSLYEDRRDKSWSLTDCISFVAMRNRNVRHALTTNRDFEQAGFTALLRD